MRRNLCRLNDFNFRFKDARCGGGWVPNNKPNALYVRTLRVRGAICSELTVIVRCRSSMSSPLSLLILAQSRNPKNDIINHVVSEIVDFFFAGWDRGAYGSWCCGSANNIRWECLLFGFARHPPPPNCAGCFFLTSRTSFGLLGGGSVCL